MMPIKNYKKAIILGAGGFIGINLANNLDGLGYELVCFDRKVVSHWPKSAKIIVGDFAKMPVELLAEMDDAVVFHLVSSCRPLPDTVQATDEVINDLAGTLRYLEATKRRNLRWVFLSSGGTVYGQTESECISEETPTNPICSYGLVKITIEKYFELYRKLHQLDYVIVRLANPFGPWQHPLKGQGIIAAIIYKTLKDEPIEIWGDGTNVRDYIYITDAVRAIASIAECGISGEIYNIASGKGLSIIDLTKIIGNALDKIPLIRYSDARPTDVKRNVLETEKFTALVNRKPSVTSIEDGIFHTGAWIKENLNTFKV